MIGSGLTGTGNSGANTLVTLGANTLVGDDGNDTFVFFAGSANGATVDDFGSGDEGDVLVFSGFGTVAQGASFTPDRRPTNGRSIPASMPTTRPSRSRTAPRRIPGISSSCEARQSWCHTDAMIRFEFTDVSNTTISMRSRAWWWAAFALSSAHERRLLSSGNAAHSQHHYLFGGTPVPVDQLEAMGPPSTSIGICIRLWIEHSVKFTKRTHRCSARLRRQHTMHAS